ncbi:MAG: hypothetical protein V2B15_18670 [Bacteroidota bacterium]
MKPFTHKLYIGSMVLLLAAATAFLIYSGYFYYNTSLEERFYHPDHHLLKPNGLMGHGLGIIGSISMLAGVSIYMMRKRIRSLARVGKLKHWLEFHIFLCTFGPILVLFHTSFKIGGVVAISFWSMMAVVLSGVIGRFIYIQIPRTIEGREMSLNEVRDMKTDIGEILVTRYALDQVSLDLIIASTKNRGAGSVVRNVKSTLKNNRLSRPQRAQVMKLVKNEISLNRRIDRLETMQNLFKYWHVAHLPFALIMLIIMVIHVAVSILFGYTWIF